MVSTAEPIPRTAALALQCLLEILDFWRRFVFFLVGYFLFVFPKLVQEVSLPTILVQIYAHCTGRLSSPCMYS